jgi:putative ABC transport system permease protein
LYSVLAFAVRSRTREIGVRVALGARPADVVGLVLRRALVISAAGTVAGLLLAISTWRLLASLIYGVNSFDLWAFVAGPAVLALVAVAASCLPARRAAQIDAMAALRYD